MEAMGAQLLCDPRAAPGMAPAVGHKWHTKSLGVLGCTLQGFFSSWALFLPWLRFLLCLCLLTLSNRITMMCFLSLAAGKRQYWASGTFTLMLLSSRRVNFPYIFYILKILRLFNAANALLAPYIETWTTKLKIFSKEIPSLKNTVMFLKHTYSQPTWNCPSVILLFDNNENKFCRHKLLCYLCNQTLEFFVNGPEQKMEADRAVKFITQLIVGIYLD